MDWLRRNWPDLLIGVALVVVIAMIIVTLLSGGSLASLVRRDTPQPLATTGGAQTTDDSAIAADGDGGSSDDAAANNQANTSANTQANTQTNTPAGGAAATDDGYDVFVPGVPGRDAAAGEAEAADTDSSSTDLGSDASASGVQGAEAEAGAEDGALPAVSQSGGFRVAAGATNSRDGARTLAESYRGEGLEVTVEQKDDLYLLWVGPYGTRADADNVAEAIIAGGGDALVYGYDGESDDAEAAEDVAAEGAEDTGNAASDTENTVTENTGTENAVTESATQNSLAAGAGNGDGTVLADNGASRTPAADAGTAGSDTTVAGATGNAGATIGNAVVNAVNGNEVAEDLAAGAGAGERYLQVGAFASDASAAPRLAQLEQLGLNVTNSEDAGGLLRLFVGPYGEAQIAQIQTRLNAQGIESFPVSQ